MTDQAQELAKLFVEPVHPAQKQYEALRARFVDRKPWADIAEQFGLNQGTLRNMGSELRKSRTLRQFDDPKTHIRSQRDRRIIELRQSEHLSAEEIAGRLKAEGLKAGATTVGNVLKQAGFPKLPRRKARPRVIKAAQADIRRFKPTVGRWRTRFGGLFLFARDLAQAGLDGLLTDWPTSRKVPAGAMIRALLALKLWGGGGRPYQVMPDILDQGSALFAGLNVLPKKSTLSEYSTRVDAAHLRTLMDAWHGIAQRLLPAPEHSFDLDFHTIPYHGDEALMQKHFVSKRSRRQRGVLALVAREATQRAILYANAEITKESQPVSLFIGTQVRTRTHRTATPADNHLLYILHQLSSYSFLEN